MKPVNIFILTRVMDTDASRKLERQMSKRSQFLKVKEWEMQGLRAFSDALLQHMEHAEELCFFYSFVLPRLGKEFDLLRISENSVINNELKSGNISDEAIRKQLMLNRYYLATLGKEIYSYTYISDENRLVKLSNSNHIQEADWSWLVENLQKQENCYVGDVEDLFKEERYLISPIADPEHFLRREYFLTSQQLDIKRKILRNIAQNPYGYQGITGLPGTGKSILLYDIAMELSRKKKICVFHLGSKPDGLKVFDERLKRVDFFCCAAEEEVCLKEDYGAVLIDEGHWLTACNLSGICGYAKEKQIPVLIAYDREDALALEERRTEGIEQVERLPEFTKYQLTNRIRVNGEISSFVYQVMHNNRMGHRYFYPSVELAYANTREEAEVLIGYFRKNGYQYITNRSLGMDLASDEENQEKASEKGAELDQVVMFMDDSFRYDVSGYLRSCGKYEGGNSPVRSLYHGLNRAKKRVAIVVAQNPPVFMKLMNIVQKDNKE